MTIRDMIIEQITEEDLNPSERALYAVFGRDFLRIYKTNLCGVFTIEHISKKRRAIKRAVKEKKVDKQQLALELGISTRTLFRWGL